MNRRPQKSKHYSGSLKILLLAGILKTIAARQIRKSTWLRRESLKKKNMTKSRLSLLSVHFVANEVKTECTFYLKFDFLSLYSLVLFRIGAVYRLMQVLIFVVERKTLGLLGNRLLFNSRKRTGTPEDFDKMVQIILETWRAFYMTVCSFLLQHAAGFFPCSLKGMEEVWIFFTASKRLNAS